MKKLLSILLCLALSTALLLPAQAAAPGSFLFQNYDIAEETVYCYGTPLPSGGTLTVSCGSTTVQDAGLTSIKNARVPVTVYCLVDTSSALASAIQQQEKDVLKTLNTLMGDQDSMVIATIDNTFFEGKLLTDRDSRSNAIDTIARSSWKTNLYTGIERALDSVCTNTTYRTNRFLVILSDGHSRAEEPEKTAAILEKIKVSRIPVWTILLGESGSGRTQNEIPTLKQYSDASVGGSFVNLSEEKISAVNAADRFWDSVQNSSVISVGAASLPADQDVELLLRYETATTRFEDTALIRAVDLAGVVPPTEDTTEDTSETTEPVEDEPPEEKEFPWLLVGIAAAVAVAAVVVLLLLRRKKPLPQQEELTLSSDADVISSGEDWASDVKSNSGFESDSGFEAGSDSIHLGPTKPVTGDCHVFMVAIMHPDVARDFWLTEGVEQKIGRDSSSAVILNSNDKNLSRVHAAFLWDGAHLLVRDLRSTCGTFINGTPCAGEAWYLVENGASVRAGAYDYRVTYEKKASDTH